MAFNPIGQAYKPDPVASGGASSRPLQEGNVPKTGNIVPSLLRLAMRRLPAMGFGAVHGSAPIGVRPPSNAMTIGSHGRTS